MWLCLLLTLSCWRQEAPPADPGIGRGTWQLKAESTLGLLVLDDQGCQVGIWGDLWTTGGPELARCEVEAQREGATEPGAWLYFPFRTGAGDGYAAARVDPEAPRLVVPLGNRAADGALVLERVPGTLSGGERAAAAAAADASVAAEQAGWARGELALLDGEQLVGELHLTPTGAALGVYDATWMTDGLVDTEWGTDGPVMIFQFPVMPALSGEEGMLRINPVNREVRVPFGLLPGESDRVMRAAFRSVTSDEAAEAIHRAREGSLEREGLLVGELAKRLAAESAGGEGSAGGCLPPEALPGDWPIWLAGYEVTVTPVDDTCEVVLEPDPVQHGRRLAVRARPDAVLDQVARSTH
jgi:hypothetical protein